MSQEWPEPSGETNRQKMTGKREQVSEDEREVTLREALKGVRHRPLGLLPDDLELSNEKTDIKYFNHEELVELLTEKMGLSDEKAQGVLTIRGGKTRQHIIRMLDPSRSPAEQNFASWFSKEHTNIERNFVSHDKELKEIIGGEKGIETPAFWTMAPYLFQEIQERARKQGDRIWQDDAMYLVFDWLKQSVEQNDGRDFRLIGLDDMLEEYRKIRPDDERFHSLKLFLPRDKSHPFHKYIQQLAKKVVEDVIYPRYLELQGS